MSSDEARRGFAHAQQMALPGSTDRGQSAAPKHDETTSDEELSYSFFGGDSASGSLPEERDASIASNPPSKTDRVKRVQETADMIVNLLLDTNPNPSSVPIIQNSISSNSISTPLNKGENALQALVLEETAKLIGALSRKQWHDLRLRSGRTSTGRSRLGALVDPLGLFRSGKLVNTDANDEKILASASAIVEALTKLSGSRRRDGLELSGEANFDSSIYASLCAVLVLRRLYK